MAEYRLPPASRLWLAVVDAMEAMSADEIVAYVRGILRDEFKRKEVGLYD